MLEQIGFKADVAENGVKALASLVKASAVNPYSLVLMDCQMPEMDGYEATRQIRKGKAGEQNRTIPIVAMTANAMRGDKERCLNAGMSDYLAKPIEAQKLKAMLLAWLKVGR